MAKGNIFSSLDRWRIFMAVARLGNLSRAAIELDMDVSRISRTISELEKEIGAPLLNRAKRPFALTAVGKEITGRLEICIRQWDAFEDFVVHNLNARTTIRLSTPAGIGRFYLNKQIAEYRQIDPDVTIESSIEGGVEDVLNGRIDVAFVSYVPNRTDLNVYPAMHAFTMPLAHPDYINRHGMPKSPEQLIEHTGILKVGTNFPVANYLVRNKEHRTVFWKQVVRHGDMLNIKDAVLRGYGIAVDIPLGMVLDELKRGELVMVLDGWHRDFWNYTIVTRAGGNPNSPVERFAAWYARRATQEIDERREAGFALLGLNPNTL